MSPDYHSPVLSPFSIDLNEDQNQPQHDLISSKSQPSSSSSSSLSSPSFFNPVQDQGGYFHREPQQFHQHHEEAKLSAPQGGSCGSTGLKLSIWKKEDRDNENQSENSSVKWMSSKMRLMRKMMNSDHQAADLPHNPRHNKYESSPTNLLETDNSSNTCYKNINSNNTIRVCADCNTTKTPLWRSGPRGPKSLCNACGIRQRKARRAMAAAAAATNGGTVVAETPSTKINKAAKHKDKRSSNGCVNPPQFKKKCKLGSSPSSQGRKSTKLCFEDLRIILSKNSAFHRVFPQDEKEAAILLMALSYGLVHG